MKKATLTPIKIQKTIKLFIGGDFPRTESGRSFPIYLNKTKTVYAQVCQASRKDLRNAVSAAQSAQPGWAAKSAFNRSQILYRMAEMTEARRSELATDLMATLGLNERAAVRAIDDSIAAFVYFAGWADKYQQVIAAVNPVSGPHHNFSTGEPVGIVGLIAEPQFDLPGFIARISAIIASGNSVVALMSEKGSALLAGLAEIFATSDLPKGVVNLLTGFADELYKPFASHMEINAMTCAENDPHRAEIKVMAAENMKRVPGLRGPNLSLETLTAFIEIKTVWHPIGS